MCVGVAEVSGSECSDSELADDADDVSANCVTRPLLRHSDAADASRLSKQGQKALRHLEAVDSSVRTVVSSVVSSRTLRRSFSNPIVLHRRRAEGVPLWNRMRWWIIVAATTFVVVPLIFVLYVVYKKFISQGS